MENAQIPYDDVDFEAQEKALQEQLSNFKFDENALNDNEKADGGDDNIDFGGHDDDDLANAFSNGGIDDDALLASLDPHDGEGMDMGAFDDDAIARLEAEIANERAGEDKLIGDEDAKSKPSKKTPKPAPAKATPAAKSPKPDTTAAPTPAKSSPKPSKDASPAPTSSASSSTATSNSSAPAPASTSIVDKVASKVPSASAATLAAHISAERSEAYKSVIASVKANIDALNSQIKLLLVTKQPGDQARASKYLEIRRNRERGLEQILAAMKRGDPVPAFKIVSLPLERERKAEDVQEDEVKSGHTNTVKGSKYLKFDHTGSLKLVPRAREMAAFVKSVRQLRMRVEAWEKGFIWDDKIAEGDFKMASLLSEHRSRQTVKLRDEANNLVCEADMEVVLRRPFTGRDVVKEVKNIVVVDETAEGSDTLAAQPGEAVSVPVATPAPAAASPAAQPARVKPTRAAEVEEEEAAPFALTDALLREVGAPEAVTAASVQGALDIASFASVVALNNEKEHCLAQAGKADAEARKSLKSRIEDIDQQVGVFSLLQATGKLDFETYLSSIKDAVEIDENVTRACLLVAKSIEKKHGDEASALKHKAVAIMRRVKTMKEEIEAMENMDDEEDE